MNARRRSDNAEMSAREFWLSRPTNDKGDVALDAIRELLRTGS